MNSEKEIEESLVLVTKMEVEEEVEIIIKLGINSRHIKGIIYKMKKQLFRVLGMKKLFNNKL